jgi:hypothetical protein
MSNRYLGVVALERFLAVERYRESHQVVVSSRPQPLASTGPDRAGSRPTRPVSGRAANPRT